LAAWQGGSMSTVDFFPARTIRGRVAGLYAARGKGFETEQVESLKLDYEGIPGDVHAGYLRRSGPREPWYARGTEMRNERQLSLLAVDELAAVAEGLGVDKVAPEWIGGNILMDGIAHFSLLPPRTILMFEGGVSIRLDGDNGPCRAAGRSVAKRFAGRGDIEFGFVKAARRRRGVLGWVERAGIIQPGETVTVRIWEQWIYPADKAGS
jgi:hypothetical protein